MLTLDTGKVGLGVTFGMAGAIIGELLACLFVNHGDTHIDPPTFALVGTFSLFPLLNLTGIFNINSNIVWLFPIIISITGYITLMFLRKESIKLNTKVIRDEQF